MVPIILSYACVYLVWGSTYFFMKMAVMDMPAPLILGMRFTIAGLLLFGIAALQRKPIIPLLSPQKIFWSVIMGILLLVTGNGLVTVAVKYVDSYVAALIVATTPISVMLLDRLLWKTKIVQTGLIGAIIGMAGIAMLQYSGHGFSFSASWYDLLIFGGVLSWGLATSISKKVPLPGDPLISSALQSLAAGLIATTISCAAAPGGNVVVQIAEASHRAMFAVLYLALFGGISFYAFAYLLKHEPNSRIVTYAFVNPIIAVGIGIIIGQEARLPLLVPAVLTILSGLAMMFYGKNFSEWIQKKFSVKS